MLLATIPETLLDVGNHVLGPFPISNISNYKLTLQQVNWTYTGDQAFICAVEGSLDNTTWQYISGWVGLDKQIIDRSGSVTTGFGCSGSVFSCNYIRFSVNMLIPLTTSGTVEVF